MLLPLVLILFLLLKFLKIHKTSPKGDFFGVKSLESGTEKH